MKRKNLLAVAGLAILTVTSCQAFASSDDVWTDYDPCGWSVEQEAREFEVAVVEEPWSDYDPCGWNVEQEGIESEVAKAFVVGDELTGYVN